jgi:hypothetical protein
MVSVFEKPSDNADSPNVTKHPLEKAPTGRKVKRTISFPWSKKTAGKAKVASQDKALKVANAVPQIAYVVPESLLSPEGSDSDDSSKVPSHALMKNQAQDSDSDDDEPRVASSPCKPKVESLPVELAKDQGEENDSSEESSLEDESNVATLTDLKTSLVPEPKVASLPEHEKDSGSSDEVQPKGASLPDLKTPSVPKPNAASLSEEEEQRNVSLPDLKAPSVPKPNAASLSEEEEQRNVSLPDLKAPSVPKPNAASLSEEEQRNVASLSMALMEKLPGLKTPSDPKPDVASLPGEEEPNDASVSMALLEKNAKKSSYSDYIQSKGASRPSYLSAPPPKYTESKVASLPSYLLGLPNVSKPEVAHVSKPEVPPCPPTVEAETEGSITIDPYDGPQLQQDMKQLQQDMKQLQQDIKLTETDSDTALSTTLVSDTWAPEDGWNSDSSNSSDGVKITRVVPWGFKRNPHKPPRPLLTAKEKKKRRKEKEKLRAAKEPPLPPPEDTKEEDAAASLAMLQITSRRGKEGASTEHVKSEATSSYEDMNGSWVLPVKTDIDDMWGNPARPIEHRPGDQTSTQSGDDTTKDSSTNAKTAPEDESDDVSFADDDGSISMCGTTGSVQDTIADDKPTPEPVVSRKHIPSPAAAARTTHAPSADREMMSPPEYAERSDPTPVNTPIPSHSATPVPASVLEDSLASQDSWVPRYDLKKDAEKQEMLPDPTLQQFEAHKLAWDMVVPREKKEIVIVDRSLGKEGTWLPPHAGSIQRGKDEDTKQSSRAMSDSPTPPEKAPPRSVSTSKDVGLLPAAPSTKNLPLERRPGLLPAFPSNINMAGLLPAPQSNRKIPVQGRAVRVDFTGAVTQEQKDIHDGSRVPSVAAMQKETKVGTSETATDGQEARMKPSSILSLVSITSTATEDPPRIFPGDRRVLPRKPSLPGAMLDRIYPDQLEEQRSPPKPDAGKLASQNQECKPGSKYGASEPASQIASGGPAAISGRNKLAKKATPKPISSILKMLVICTLLLVCGAIAGVLVHFLM